MTLDYDAKSQFDREQEIIGHVAAAFSWPGRVGEFLGCLLLASMGSWLIGGFPFIFAMLFYWLFNLDPNSAIDVAVSFGCASLISGLILLAWMRWGSR